MTVTESDTLTQLLDGITDNPDDWQRWLIVADWLADQGDEIGEDGARWLADKRIHLRYDSQIERWYWYGSFGHEVSSFPTRLNDRIFMSTEDNYIGRRTAMEWYDVFFSGWRSFTDEQRKEFWHWMQQGSV